MAVIVKHVNNAVMGYKNKGGLNNIIHVHKPQYYSHSGGISETVTVILR